MPINENATMQDDLQNLPRDQLLSTIQGLLLNSTSEAVEARLDDQRVDLQDMIVPAPGDDTTTSLDLLDSPFFVVSGLPDVNVPTMPSNRSRPFSANESTTGRKVLKNFYSFDVRFAEWTEFDNVMNGQDITALGNLPRKFSSWGKLIKLMLTMTHEAKVERVGEIQELSVMFNALSRTFEAFEYGVIVENGSNVDATCFNRTTKGSFLFSEGKEAACLPCGLNSDGHHLCTIGFATKVCRVKWEADPIAKQKPTWHTKAEQNNDLRAGLQTVLGLQVGDTMETTNVSPSATTNSILRDHQIIAVAKDRHTEHLTAGRMLPRDPVNLWAAVMQACNYSVVKNRSKTIVMSARKFWFIDLGTAGTLKVSRAVDVGSRGFLMTVVRFFNCANQVSANDAPTLNPTCRRAWEAALGTRQHRTSERLNKKKAPSSAANNDPSNRGNKRPRTEGSSSRSTPLERQSGEAVVASVSFDNDEDEICFGYDDFDIAIPWFDQIGDTLEVLGRGRSGKVTKVVWDSREVALKTFILKRDDKRDLQGVYEHELDVLRSLKKLWGTHVPAMMFHKPWATSPMIGLELGEQLADDMTEWSEEDLHKADTTIAKIRELGWCQKDTRGANFVRIRGEKTDWVAMIDFESMERIKAPAPLFST
jgi:hypothetical protein